MPNMRAIKAKISSVQNINQITKALEVVSTVKLKKVKDQTDAYRSFMNESIALLHRLGGMIDVFGDVEVKADRTLMVVIGSEKGLCGSLNAKLFKVIDTDYAEKKDTVDIYAVGKKTKEFFRRNDYTIAESFSLADSFDTSDLVDVYQFLQDAISSGTYARVTLAFNYFHNALTQEPVFLDLFPLEKETFEEFVSSMGLETDTEDVVEVTDIEVEPDAAAMSAYLRNLLITYMVYGALLQNKTGEFASRMIAMKNAKDNSTDVIKNLRITFNKARQAAVTQEISEIVSAKMSMEG